MKRKSEKRKKRRKKKRKKEREKKKFLKYFIFFESNISFHSLYCLFTNTPFKKSTTKVEILNFELRIDNTIHNLESDQKKI